MGFRVFLSVLLLSSCFIINVFGGDIDQDHVTSSQETSHFVHEYEVLDHSQEVVIGVSVDAEKDGDDTTKEEEYARVELCLDREMHVSGRAVGCIGTVNVTSAITELVNQYERKFIEVRTLRGRITQYERKFVEMEIKHQKVVDELKKELEEAHAFIDNVNCANITVINRPHELYLPVSGLEEKISKFADINKASLKRIKDVYDSALVESEKLHEELNMIVDQETRSRGEEYLQSLGKMESALWCAALHCGIKKGYDGCRDRLELEKIRGYNLQFCDEYKEKRSEWYQHIFGKPLEADIKALE